MKIDSSGVINSVSAAIDATTTGIGTVSVANKAAIKTTGVDGNGLSTSTIGGNTTITNTGTISVAGTNAYGIVATSTAGGSITATNYGSITQAGSGTFVPVFISTTSGDITFNQVAGAVTANGLANSPAVWIATSSGSANATINMSGGSVSNNSLNSNAHGMSAEGGGTTTGDTKIIISAGSVHANAGIGVVAWNRLSATATGNIIVKTAAGTSISSGGREGIAALGASAAAGTSILIDSQSQITAAGRGIVGVSMLGAPVTIQQTGGSVTSVSSGIFANTSGTANIVNSGSILTTGVGGNGLQASSTGGAQVTVTNSGSVTTVGHGILAQTTALGSVIVNNSGVIRTSDNGSRGIFAITVDGAVTAASSGAINTVGIEAHGIQTTASGLGPSSVTTLASINASGQFAAGIFSRGSTTAITIGVGATVAGGWQSDTTSVGGSGIPSAGVGIGSNGGGARLTNNGALGALSDRAVAELSRYGLGATGSLQIVNSGTITGFLEFGAGASIFRNLTQASFDIRHFADTNGDGIRDTKRVAITDFGAGTDQFFNEANGVVRLAPAGGAKTTDATGYYIPTTGTTSRPLEASFYDFNREGILQGQLVNLETFDNAGIVDLRGTAVGNSLVITGNAMVGGAPGTGVFISNGGQLLLNSVLNAGIPLGSQTNSYSDMLIVDQTALGAGGATAIKVTNVGGIGAYTPGNGIELVEVRDKQNSVAGVFTLNGDYKTSSGEQAVVGGAYAYTLFHGGVASDVNDGNWYLRSVLVPTEPVKPTEPETPIRPRYQPGVPLYEVYPQHLLNLIASPTMQQRVGNRYWKEQHTPETVFCKDPSQNFRCKITGDQAKYYANGSDGRAVIEDSAIWMRIEGRHNHIEPALTTSGSTYDSNIWKLQAGLDALLHETEAGNKLLGGINLSYGRASTDVKSLNGNGKLSTDGYGVGGTLTWLDQSGFYIDGQVNLTWFKSDLNSDFAGRLRDGNNGFGYSLSGETGKKIDLNDLWTVTPQAQLIYSKVNFDSFTDPFGAEVSLDKGDSLKGRLGLSVDRSVSWKDDEGKTRRSQIYGIANLYNEFLNGTQVDVSSTKISSRAERLSGGLGLGGTYNWNNDKYSVFGEVGVDTSLRNFADSYSVNGTAGFRVKW